MEWLIEPVRGEVVGNRKQRLVFNGVGRIWMKIKVNRSEASRIPRRRKETETRSAVIRLKASDGILRVMRMNVFHLSKFIKEKESIIKVEQ